MNTQIQTSIDIVSNSFPSIFTKDDVIKLLTDLDSKLVSDDKPTVIGLDIDQVKRIVEDSLSNAMSSIDWEDIVDKNNADLYMSGNEVYIDSINVDTSSVERELKDYIFNDIDQEFHMLSTSETVEDNE